MKSLATWTTERLFNYVHGNYLVYNTCWEDPRLDREVMAMGPEDEVVLITSAGCNALDYALDGPRQIHSVDMNFRQNALLELKIAGIRHLDFDQFFSIFGDGGTPVFPDLYRSKLRASLSPVSQAYWDRHFYFFARTKPTSSFYHRGTTGFFARGMVRYFKMAGVYEDILRVFSAGSLEEQREIYHDRVRAKLWRPAIKRALQTDLALSLLGVPAAQKQHLERTCGQSMADFMEDSVEAVCTRLPVSDNYFWRLYLFGRYSRDCCPSYLQEENFKRLKNGLVDRIKIHTGSLTQFLHGHTGGLSRFVLLDHMDWLSHRHPEALAEEWQAIVTCARKEAQVLWRSGGFRVDYVDPLVVQHQGSRCRVGELLNYNTRLAEACHQRDRVHTYGSFYIARFNH